MIWLGLYLVLGVLVTLGLWVWDSARWPGARRLTLADLLLNVTLWPLALFCAVFDS